MPHKLHDLSRKYFSFLTSPVQIVLLIVFVSVNAILFMASQSNDKHSGANLNSVYSQAADGQRYWGTAINLIEKGRFTIPSRLFSSQIEEDVPLARAGPLPALLFSLPIRVFGFAKAPIFIVALQCAFLFAMGRFARRLIEPFSANKNIAQALVIFNPNLIGSSHLAQSDLLFAFAICLLLLLINNVVTRPERLKLNTFVFIGIVAGLIPLVRPFSYYFLLPLPLVILFAYSFFSTRPFKNIITLAKYLILSTIIATSVMLPWMIRNQQVFGTLAMTHEEGTIFEQQFEFLLTHNGIDKKQWSSLIRNAYRKHGDEACFEDPSRLNCQDLKTKVFFNAIIDQPKINIAKAFVTAWGGLLFSGSTSSIAKYIGVQEGTPFYFSGTYKWFASTKNYIATVYSANRTYMILFIAFSSFAILARIVGIFGLLHSLKKKEHFSLSAIYSYTVIIFLGLYLFMPTSRLRIPLEVILMLYATIGITYISRRIRIRRP
jgi:hypothetical protein